MTHAPMEMASQEVLRHSPLNFCDAGPFGRRMVKLQEQNSQRYGATGTHTKLQAFQAASRTSCLYAHAWNLVQTRAATDGGIWRVPVSPPG